MKAGRVNQNEKEKKGKCFNLLLSSTFNGLAQAPSCAPCMALLVLFVAPTSTARVK